MEKLVCLAMQLTGIKFHLQKWPLLPTARSLSWGGSWTLLRQCLREVSSGQGYAEGNFPSPPQPEYMA